MARGVRATFASLLCLVALCFACRRHRPSGPAYPRYWLHAVDAPGLAPGADLLLVELLPDGRVRSVTGGIPFEAPLPTELSSKPKWERGLALHVSRATDLHYLRPDGPLLGRVLPGTLVSVASPNPLERESVGVALWNGEIAYVEAAALGVTAPPKASWTPPPGARSALSPVLAFVDDGERSHDFTFASCEPVFLAPGTYRATQYHRGFEVSARVTDVPLPVHFTSTECPATALTALPSEMPSGFTRIDEKAGDAVAETLRLRGSFSWLRANASGAACESWRFHPRSESTGELVRDGAPQLTHPVTFRRAFPGHPATLFLGSIELDHHSVFKCDCSIEYLVVGAGFGEVAMMARRLPAQSVAYVSGEAERWFLSPGACETARAGTEKTLDTDPAKAWTLGFHAYESAEP